MNATPPDWQLPSGVSRGVWQYAHDDEVARSYDANLADTPLLQADLAFVKRHLPTPRRVIDLGCGTGRAAIELARGGHSVVGVDLSQPMLDVAANKASTAGVGIEWLCGNIVELSHVANQQFDAALCLFSTLGMIAGAECRLRVIEEAKRLLRPRGMLLLHVHHIGHHWKTRAGRKLLMADVLRRLGRRPDVGDFAMPNSANSPSWSMHLFTKRELLKFLHSVGFEIVELCPIDVQGNAVSRWFAYGFLVAARRSE